MRALSSYLLPVAAVLLTLALSNTCAAPVSVPILAYHRFGPIRSDSMTVTTRHFEEQLDLLAANGLKIVPLSEIVAWRLGRGPAPAPGSIVLTIDDGHVSVYREAKRLIIERKLPVTLFIYPSAISNASYAMTWDELRELAATGLFDVQSHTFWHPNFKREARRLDEPSYSAFVDNQLKKSKAVLAQRLNRPITLLAWPFGIYDDFLMQRAAEAGYDTGFSIDGRAMTLADPALSLPRCLVSDAYTGPRFLGFLRAATQAAKK